MAPKVLRNRTQYSSTMRNDLYESLKKHSLQTDIPISKLLDKAVEQFFDKQKAAPDS